MRKILLTTIGTLGDLHPFIALALALGERGFAPVLAVAEDQIGKVRGAGLDAVAILPGFEAIRRRMGVDESDAVRRIMDDQREMLEQVLLPALSASTAALDLAAADAEAIIASIFMFAAPIVAEKHGTPLISVVLQPMAMLSAFDPPATPDFWMMKASPAGNLGAAWNRAVYAMMRQVLRLLYSRRIDGVRAEHGLPARGAARMLEPGSQARLVLGCYSPLLGTLPRDALPNTRIVGFPIFDSHSGAPEALDPALVAFLGEGPPPIVFTLGTFAVHGAGTFYAEAAETARRLGRRAVLLTGEKAAPARTGDIFRCAYAPHSLLFPRAAAIVHHGGVGTTGQALRAGKPQLIVPHMGDQNDHAHRIRRMGVGLSLKASRFTAGRAAPLIAALLREGAYRCRALEIGQRASLEHGADAAADAIEEALSHVPVPHRRKMTDAVGD